MLARQSGSISVEMFSAFQKSKSCHTVRDPPPSRHAVVVPSDERELRTVSYRVMMFRVSRRGSE